MGAALVTGSSGLVGSEAVAHFTALGFDVVGVDNDMRRDFFGEPGSTLWNRERLRREFARFRHVDLDVRDREGVARLVADVRPALLVHCAGQPSHDLAARRPFDDFDVNAVGTLNLLEAVRRHAPEAVFILMSTNKVYGDSPNELPLVELETRWDYARAEDREGIDETCRIDRNLHSLFGVSKAAADLLTQEYGRYFGLKTGVFRAGCVTGPLHAGVELHGFLSYLVKVARSGGVYTIYGYKGKQVRDQIHSADLCRAFEAFFRAPRPGEVYNIGGGRANSLSVLESIRAVEARLGRRLEVRLTDQARRGDHICYITNFSKFQAHYPGWSLQVSLDRILDDMAASPFQTSR